MAKRLKTLEAKTIAALLDQGRLDDDLRALSNLINARRRHVSDKKYEAATVVELKVGEHLEIIDHRAKYLIGAVCEVQSVSRDYSEEQRTEMQNYPAASRPEPEGRIYGYQCVILKLVRKPRGGFGRPPTWDVGKPLWVRPVDAKPLTNEMYREKFEELRKRYKKGA